MNSDLILLDTNIVIYALQNDPTTFSFVNEKRCAISFVTEIELLGWNGISTNDINLINSFLSECLYLDYSYQVKQRTITIKKAYNIKLGDAFIAATSIEFDIPLVSADKIFERISELKFVHITPNNE